MHILQCFDEGWKSTSYDNTLVGFATLMPTKLMKINYDFVMTYTFDLCLNWFHNFGADKVIENEC